MKKAILITMAGLMIFAAGCVKKGSQESKAAAEEPSSEALSENSLSAKIQKIEEGKLTVETGEGKVYSFDSKGATLDSTWELMTGDEVEIGYEGTEPQDGMAIKKVTVSVPYEFTTEEFNDESNIYGEITAVDDKNITIKEIPDFREAALEGEDTEGRKYGDTMVFQRAPFELDLTKEGLAVGKEISIYYLGDVKSNPLAFYTITEDALEEEDANDLQIKGTLEKVEGDILTLKSDDSHIFRFTTNGDQEVTKAATENVGKTVVVTYSTSLRARVSVAEGVKAVA